jgi:hypothetical protein
MTFSFNVFGGVLTITFSYKPTEEEIEEIEFIFGKKNLIN